VTINIDVSSLLDQVYLDKSQTDNMVDSVIKDLTNAFAREWEQVAAENLKSARQEYIANLNVVDEGFAKGAVVLTGVLPNMLEEGVDAFDIKEGLLAGPNVKTGKDGGRYNTVPYKQGTPGSLPENFNGGIMPKEVHAVAKKKSIGKQLVKDDLPKQFQEPRKQIVPSRNAVYTHKNSIYEGIQKNKDLAGNVSYISFRRVSDNSDDNAWIHPGLEARNFADKAFDNFQVDAQISAAFDSWWNKNM
jgi:hypothetical protein